MVAAAITTILRPIFPDNPGEPVPEKTRHLWPLVRCWSSPALNHQCMTASWPATATEMRVRRT